MQAFACISFFFAAEDERNVRTLYSDFRGECVCMYADIVLVLREFIRAARSR